MLPFSFMTTFLLLFFCSQPALSLNHEGLLLHQFKNHLTDLDNSLSSWNPSDTSHTTPCHWWGVTCGNATTTPVTITVTPLCTLNGSLPAIPLCPHSTLSIPGNFISDTIPQSLSACRRLRHLDLSQNTLVGTIPSSPPSTTSTSPSTTSPATFSLNSATLFTASIQLLCAESAPKSTQLANLKELWHSGCNLIGPIPNSIGNLTRLENLDLSKNKFTGEIPESLSGLNSVFQIELYENALTGALPRGLFRNELVGSLPSELGSNSLLQIIDVSFNRFSGELPAGLCRWGKLEELLMLFNSFSWKISESLGNCTSLRRVRIGNNNLSGKFQICWVDPDEIGSLNNLLEFHGGNNKLSGRIRDSMAKLIQLGTLDLSYNEMSGEILGWIGGLNILNELNLAHNRFRFSSTIPKELGRLSELTVLDLSSNQFFETLSYVLKDLGNVIAQGGESTGGMRGFSGPYLQLLESCSSLGWLCFM
ncbi:receptor-like protein kinase 5 [Arachis stenosperma]|uniref:receptor-like protein kinase 5 n=1 Tax=Arachis stenosperma TaxID=217475 RepID=UPI0025ABE42B|nr:receptor-like protein kinase 5 [Arachis stenosperma]